MRHIKVNQTIPPKEDELGARITGSAAKISGAKAIEKIAWGKRVVLRFK
jgi:hypothetical protein